MRVLRVPRRHPDLTRLMAAPLLALGLALCGCADQAETDALIQSRIVAYSQDQQRGQQSEGWDARFLHCHLK